MADLSLKRQMTILIPMADKSVRAYARGQAADIGLRRLLSSFRIIHISDLHFTSSPYTLDWRDDHLIIDEQNSKEKSRRIGDFLCGNGRGSEFFGTNVVVITGDLTDSGDEDDYPVALDFINRLTDRDRGNFDVHVIPGNHDYCKEGNLIVAEVLRCITPPLPPGVGLPDLPLLPDEVTNTIRSDTKSMIKVLVNGEIGEELLDFLVDQLLASPPVTDTVDNAARRQRFIDKVTPHDDQYPRVKDCGNGWLILLDSMQGQLEETYDLLAQGKLGKAQLSSLAEELRNCEADQSTGKPVVVCLHHSPYDDSWTTRLDNRDDFLATIKEKIDGLLFGHVGEQQEKHDALDPTDRRAPFGNSENLEQMSDSYAVTILDFGARMRAVFQAVDIDTPLPPPCLSWLQPKP